MALLKKILGLLFSRLVLTLVGLVAIAVLIWVVGEKVAIGEVRPLYTERSRLVAIGVVVALVLLRAAWQAWRARSMNTAVVRQLIKPPRQPAAPAEPGEPEQLRARFEAAARTLREARFGGGRGFWDGLAARAGRRYLYELPWYAIIGEPGAGKTTALRHSGLRFPLAQALGADGTRGVTGVAGTRNIDWWFTDRAVLIDTAGRYVSQDSDPEADRTAWSAFLELLKRYRPSRPLNGVLVTLSVQDLLESSAAERSAQATRLRERIQELHARLGMRFPIYLLVTKCDLLAGFMETLGQADREQRAAPWGFTFPLDAEQRSDTSGLGREFDALTQRLVDGLVDRLQAERDPTRRAQIYSFPQQFAALRDLLHGFADNVFSPSPYEAHPLLRGVYFVSGTQEGTPLDRVIGTLTRSHGLDTASLPAQHGTGKSFFIERLLGEVIFAESELGGTNLKWERRRAALAAGGYVGLAVAAVALIGLWAMSWVNNRAWVDSVDARIERAERELRAARKSAPGDVAALLPGLEAVRDLVIADPRARRSWILGLGLSQGGKLDAAAGQAYRQLLSAALLPRLVARVEDDLRNSRDKPDFEYDALRIYLMLHDSRNFKPEQVRDWFADPRRSGLGADAPTAARKEMASHMATLFERGPMLSPLPRDDELVKRLRSTLAAVPLPRRVYERMLREGVGRDIPEFTPAKAGGAAMPLVFERASNAPLTQGIPGLYTYAGYHEAFQKQVVAATRRLAEEEPWVIGTADASRTSARLGDAELQRQADAVRTLYLNDYAARWRQLVTDLRLIRPRTPDEAVRVAEVLTGPSSPLKPLMTGIVRQTTLGSEAQRGAIEQATQQAQSALGKVRTGVGKFVESKPGTPVALPPGTPVEAIVDVPFAELRRQMTAGDDGKGLAPIDSTLKWLDEKLVELKAAKEAIAERHPPARPKPLHPEVARLPEPLRGVVESLAEASTKANNSASSAVLMDDLRGDVVRFCRAAIAGRYPVAPNGRDEIRPIDFATLFAPGGMMDKFFEKNLATLVDTGRLPWTVRRIDGQQAPIDAATLMQFQRAKAIRDAFFPGGAGVPSFKLQITPAAADPSILSLSLDVDGQKLRYAHGPPIPVQIAWPGPQGSTQVRLQFDPPAASGPSALVKQGPWALQRLFDTARLTLTDDPARFRATIDIGGRKADFDVTASSVYNPFRLRELTDFACPGGG